MTTRDTPGYAEHLKIAIDTVVVFYNEDVSEALCRYVIVMGAKLPIKQCRFYTHYVTLIVLVFVVKPALLLFFLMLLLS